MEVGEGGYGGGGRGLEDDVGGSYDEDDAVVWVDFSFLERLSAVYDGVFFVVGGGSVGGEHGGG